MLAITPPRPPVDVTDPIALFLLEKASPDLMAPPRPRIVNHRCSGNTGEKEVFDALHYLTLLFEAVGRKDFTVTEIARYALGISRSRIPDYLRGLCEKQLVDVTGHREIRKLDAVFWPAMYKIDLERLRKESAEVVAWDLRRENQPPPVRVIRPERGQLEMDLLHSGENGDHAPRGVDTGIGGAAGTLSRTPGSTDTGIGGRPTSQENGIRTPGSTDTGIGGPSVLLGERYPFSQENVVGMWGGREGCEEVGERAAHAPTPDEIRLMIRTELRTELHEALSSVIGANFTPAGPPPHEPIPPAPAGEIAVTAGPITTWANVTGRPTSPLDREKIGEVVRRFEKPSQGHAAYWLVRAFTSVALEDAPLTITYAGGILRRMADQQQWNSEELCRRPKEHRTEAAPEAAPAAPERVARGKAKTAPAAPAHEATPVGTPLPDEVAQHWALATWRAFAGPSVAVTLTRAQQLIVRVTDRPTWEAVLTNWQAQYQAKANWAHFDGLLERYDREIAGGRPAPTSPVTGSADIPVLSAKWIHLHPGLTADERADWVMRYHHARGNAEKRDLLTRFLAEHPITEEELLK